MAATAMSTAEVEAALTHAFNALPPPPPAKRTLAECATLVAEHLVAEHNLGAPLLQPTALLLEPEAKRPEIPMEEVESLLTDVLNSVRGQSGWSLRAVADALLAAAEQSQPEAAEEQPPPEVQAASADSAERPTAVADQQSVTELPPPPQAQAAEVKAAEERLLQDEAEAKANASKPLPEGSTWKHCGGTEIEPLLAHTTVIDAGWLLNFAEGEVMPELKGVVPAWQQVPPEATVSLDQLRQTTMESFLPVAVLSYGWTGRGHPDSTGAHLRSLIPVLRAMVNCCKDGAYGKGEGGGIPLVWGIVMGVRSAVPFGFSPRQRVPSPLASPAVLPPAPHLCPLASLPSSHDPPLCTLDVPASDFMSLPQRGYTKGYDEKVDDRTQYELLRFGNGLGSINIWRVARRASKHTRDSLLLLPFGLSRRLRSHALEPRHCRYAAQFLTTFVLDLPMPEGSENAAPVETRGWCAAALNVTACSLSLSSPLSFSLSPSLSPSLPLSLSPSPSPSPSPLCYPLSHARTFLLSSSPLPAPPLQVHLRAPAEQHHQGRLLLPQPQPPQGDARLLEGPCDAVQRRPHRAPHAQRIRGGHASRHGA